MSSRPSPLPHTFLSPITVPVVPHPCFQLIPWIPVPPTARPSCSMTQYSSLGSRAILSSHSFSYSRLGGLRNTRKCVTSKSSNQVIITGASSGRGGRRRSSLPWMTGPYMARKVKRLARGVELRGFLDVDRDRGPLGGGEIERAQVLTLRGRRLVSDQRVHQRREVLVQLTRVERHLADGSVDDAELVGPELDLAALHLAHGACHVVGDRARFRVGHEAPRSEDLSKRAYARHQVGRRDRGVEVGPALRHLLDEVLAADKVSPCLLRLASPVADREDGHPNLLASAVGQDDRPADHLLGVPRIDAQPDVGFNSRIELGDRRVLGERYGLFRGEPAVAVGGDRGLDLLGRLDVFLPVSLRHLTLLDDLEAHRPRRTFDHLHRRLSLVGVEVLPLGLDDGPDLLL